MCRVGGEWAANVYAASVEKAHSLESTVSFDSESETHSECVCVCVCQCVYNTKHLQCSVGGVQTNICGV